MWQMLWRPKWQTVNSPLATSSPYKVKYQKVTRYSEYCGNLEANIQVTISLPQVATKERRFLASPPKVVLCETSRDLPRQRQNKTPPKKSQKSKREYEPSYQWTQE